MLGQLYIETYEIESQAYTSTKINFRWIYGLNMKDNSLIFKTKLRRTYFNIRIQNFKL